MTDDGLPMTTTPIPGSVPTPDPTRLTTDAVNAATAQWRRDLAGMKDLVDTRLEAMDTATELHQNIAAEVTGRAERQLAALKELVESELAAHARFNESERAVLLEKFKSIELQFTERDVRTEQASRSSADALAAALQAAKELVNAQGEASAAAAVKSETSFTKQIDQIGTIISTLEKALDARITELKERIDRGEGSIRGSTDTHNELRMNSTLAVSVFAIFLTLIIIGVSIFAAVKK
jgi:hypothetical protein